MRNFSGNIRKYAVMFCAAAFVLTAASSVFAFFMPAEVGTWRLVAEHVTDLTASEPLGKWTSASYVRPAPPARLEVQATEGAGPGALFVPEGKISGHDGPIGFSSTYETLTIAGRRAILERNGVMGQALAVALGTRTVTFESRGLSKEELLAFAEGMIEALQD